MHLEADIIQTKTTRETYHPQTPTIGPWIVRVTATKEVWLAGPSGDLTRLSGRSLPALIELAAMICQHVNATLDVTVEIEE